MKTLLSIFLAVLAAACPLLAADAPSAALALQGLDPVTVIAGQPRQGSEELASVHGRFRYLFASAENKATFDQDPERWAFQLDGSCAMMPGVAADDTLYAVHSGRIYAFGSPSCKSDFLTDP